ncbi:MAG TPA: hypothetical protein VM490_12925, partial [Armatimonadaceae bacterium]|nr:hypothetical protein [Armatimonadaceae bacterium]
MAAAADEGGRPGFAGKVLCGYQGWFRCPGDPAGTPPDTWFHWFRRGASAAGGGLEPTVEMWPDLSEFDPDELYP